MLGRSELLFTLHTVDGREITCDRSACGRILSGTASAVLKRNAALAGVATRCMIPCKLQQNHSLFHQLVEYV